MPEDDVKNKISNLEKELYSKDFKAHRVEDILPQKEIADAPSWDAEKNSSSLLQEEDAVLKRHLFMKKFVLFSLGFFVLAVSVAAFIWWRGSNLVSGDNILIDIVAPVTVSGGESFETKFTITNSNKVSVEAATLFIEYPAGFYSVPNSLELPRASKDFGIIVPGQSVSETVNTILYGEENTNKDVTVVLEYRMAGSNATLKKTTSYSLRISSSPVNIQVTMPKEISSGQELQFTVDVSSNTKNPISSLLVDATYPNGFIFQGSTPAPTYGNNVWRIADLTPQGKRTIKIRGVVEGQESEEKVIKVSVGTESPKDERFIGVVYNATTEASTITKPFLALDLVVNNNKSKDNIVSLNKGVRVDIFWQSNNPVKVNDVVIEVKLSGAALDKYSLYAGSGGFYRSIDNTIIWNKIVNSELGTVETGGKGSLSFSFFPIALGVDSTKLIKNPQINFEVQAQAKQISAGSAIEDISTSITRSIKFATDVKLEVKGLFYSGPFTNTGPMPPKADQETTYTVSLNARNSINNISDTYVKTTLPIYVKWLGKVYPEGEDISYNENLREVTWNTGRIPAGGSREISFQISLLPSVSQVHKAPALTGIFTMVARDEFTNTEVEDKKPVITTNISLDPQFNSGAASVVD